MTVFSYNLYINKLLFGRIVLHILPLYMKNI